MQVYITGARGFVGTRLVAHLERLGHTVTAADRDIDIRDPARLTASLGAAQPEAVMVSRLAGKYSSRDGIPSEGKSSQKKEEALCALKMKPALRREPS